MSTALQGIRALVFDVFGTLVDWRGSIAREAQAALASRNVAIDWHAFADAWRAQYQPAMEEVRTGQIPFSKLDVLHRRNLEVVLKEFSIRDLDEATKVHLNLAWHRLDAWPDVAPGLQRLRERNASGAHEFNVTDAEYEQFTQYYVPPSREVGFNVIVHQPKES